MTPCPYIFSYYVQRSSHVCWKKQKSLSLSKESGLQEQSPVTHLFFADDRIIFSRANVKAVDTIIQVIKAYEDALAQKVNLTKTELSYSKNVLEEVKDLIQMRIEWKLWEVTINT